MTDLRDALRRAGAVGARDSVDHEAVAEKAQRVIRRRRALYAAGSALFVLVVGFSAFQIAEGNWFGRTTRDGTETVTSPNEEVAEIRISPKAPVVGEEIAFTIENVGDDAITVPPAWKLQLPSGDATEVTTGYCCDEEVPLGETIRVGPRAPFEAPGEYTLSIPVVLGDGENRVVQHTFTVAPEPEPKLDPIELEAPQMDEEVSSPVTVSGTADVYEGTVTIVIRDQFGEILAETFTTATCGTGCRGDFSAEVPFEVDEEQQGSIEVYSESAENGEPMFGKTVRVTLQPSAIGENPVEDDERAAIEVLSPTQDALALSPLTVSGTANTFEANVRIRILDENGEILKDTFTKATCGSGCRGDYLKRVNFTVDHEQPGVVQVFEESAENGDPINMVEIPVRLLPG